MDHILPEEMFEALHSAALLGLLVVGIYAIVKGADWLVSGAVGISQRLGAPKVIVGATIVSLGTTAPEAAVSVMAAFEGMPDFALGNSVGSIICDTGLIFGLCCLLAPLPIDRFVLNRQGWVQFGAGVLLVLVSVVFWREGESAATLLGPLVEGRNALSVWLDFLREVGDGPRPVIPQSAGFLLVALLACYLAISAQWALQHPTASPRRRGLSPEEIEEREAAKPLGIEAMWLVVGLAMVIVASHVLTQSTRVLCLRLDVPSSVVAATVIALGTSLPELVTAITSIRRGHLDLVVGNIVGADILNVLFVTGAAACATPKGLEVQPHFIYLQFPVMLTVLVTFRLMIGFGKNRFARWPGAILLLLYLVFVVGSYLVTA